MIISTVTAVLPADIKTVWNVVTNNGDTGWRSDLDHVEISPDGKTFVEFTKEGFSTQFFITEKDEYRRYRFSMENARFTGEWAGEFFPAENGGTKLVFTKRIQVKNPILRLLARFFMPVRKMQEAYVADLRQKLTAV